MLRKMSRASTGSSEWSVHSAQSWRSYDLCRRKFRSWSRELKSGSSCAAPLISLKVTLATYPEAGSHSFAYHAKALNPLYPLSTLLSHTGTKAIACKIRRRFISVETEDLLANLITLSQTKHKLCPSRVDALAWPPF